MSALTLSLAIVLILAMPHHIVGGATVKEVQVTERIQNTSQVLDGQWRVVEIDGNTLPAKAKISFVVDGHKISGQSTCNPFETTVELDGNQVLFGGLPRMPRICGPELTRIEVAFIRAFRRVDRIETLSDGSLCFHGGPVLLMRASPEMPQSDASDPAMEC